MPLKNNKIWPVSQRQVELQIIADSFTAEDGIQYEVILCEKRNTAPNQLNIFSDFSNDKLNRYGCNSFDCLFHYYPGH